MRIITRSCLAVLALAAGLGSVSCSQTTSYGDKIYTGRGSRLVEDLTAVLTVKNDQGLPVGNARVLIGPRANVPFPNNLVTTNEEGQIALPARWNDAQPVTIEAEGHVTTTYFARTPQAGTLAIKRLPDTRKLQLQGTATGFGDMPSDGKLDVGLVFPTLTRAQLGTLQISALISPETDTLSAVGRSFDLPSNLTVPTQRESYIIPITLSKPVYRLPMQTTGSHTISAARAQLPFRQMIDDIRGGRSVMDFLFEAEMKSIVARDAAITGESQSLDLPVNELTLTPTLAVQAPQYDAKYRMTSLAFSPTGERLMVTDLKRVQAGERKMLASTGSAAMVLSSLTRADLPASNLSGVAYDEMSVVTHAADSETPEFLAIPQAPEVRGASLVIHPPAMPAGLAPSVTYAVLSKVEAFDSGRLRLESKLPVWEIYAADWAQVLDLPEMPDARPRPSGQLRWEVMFGAQVRDQNSRNRVSGPQAFEKASHVSRSAVDLTN